MIGVLGAVFGTLNIAVYMTTGDVWPYLYLGVACWGVAIGYLIFRRP